jgi:serine protease DegQ
MRKTWLVFSQAVTVAMAVFFVVATLKPDWVRRDHGSVLPGIVSITSSPASPLPAVLAGGELQRGSEARFARGRQHYSQQGAAA